MPITTSSFHSLLQHIRICLLSLLFQGSPYSSQQLFDNCRTQLRKLRMVKLPTVGQADDNGSIYAAKVNVARALCEYKRRKLLGMEAHTAAYSYIIQHLQCQIKRLTSSLDFLPLRFVYLPFNKMRNNN